MASSQISPVPTPGRPRQPFIAAGIHGEALGTNGKPDPAKVDAAPAAENVRATYAIMAALA